MNDKDAAHAADDVRGPLTEALGEVIKVIKPLGALRALRDACGEEHPREFGVIQGAIEFLSQDEGD